MRKTIALKLVGGLSDTSKMPGLSFGLPTANCKTARSWRNCSDQSVVIYSEERLLSYFRLFCCTCSAAAHGRD